MALENSSKTIGNPYFKISTVAKISTVSDNPFCPSLSQIEEATEEISPIPQALINESIFGIEVYPPIFALSVDKKSLKTDIT